MQPSLPPSLLRPRCFAHPGPPHPTRTGLRPHTLKDLQHVYEGHAASRPPRNALGLALMPGAEAGPRVVVGARADTGAPVTRPSLASPYSVAPLATYGIVAAHPALQAVPIADFLPGFNAVRCAGGSGGGCAHSVR